MLFGVSVLVKQYTSAAFTISYQHFFVEEYTCLCINILPWVGTPVFILETL